MLSRTSATDTHADAKPSKRAQHELRKANQKAQQARRATETIHNYSIDQAVEGSSKGWNRERTLTQRTYAGCRGYARRERTTADEPSDCVADCRAEVEIGSSRGRKDVTASIEHPGIGRVGKVGRVAEVDREGDADELATSARRHPETCLVAGELDASLVASSADHFARRGVGNGHAKAAER